MFEDALVESTGRLKTQSKYWTLGTLALNAGMVALLILIPLLNPEALPKTLTAAMLVAPAPPPPPTVQTVTARPQAAQSPAVRQFTAPASIPRFIHESDEPSNPQPTGPISTMSGPAGNTTGFNLIPLLTVGPPMPVVRSARVHVSTGVEAGNLLVQTKPVYPPIAQAAHISGTVLLHAVISKAGTIENLAVVSGPVMLRQAALDGVKSWRYKPYLLNGEPTEVDTTITVNFTAND